MARQSGSKPVKMSDSYKSAQEVLDVLEARGIKCSRGTIYRDIKLGKLKRELTGRFLRSEVETYAAMQLNKHAPGGRGAIASDIATLQARKLAADAARLEGVVRKQDMDYEVAVGKLCKSESFYRALAERVAILRSRLRASFQVNALDYQRMSLDDMVEAYFRDLDVALNEYSRPPEYESEGVPDVFDEDVLGKLQEEETRKKGKAGKGGDGESKN